MLANRSSCVRVVSRRYGAQCAARRIVMRVDVFMSCACLAWLDQTCVVARTEPLQVGSALSLAPVAMVPVVSPQRASSGSESVVPLEDSQSPAQSAVVGSQSPGSTIGGRSLSGRLRGDTLASCEFQCGTVRAVSELFRTNSRARPVCYPCHAAKRAIAAAVSNNPAAKAALKQLMAEDPDGYRAKVRACRVEPGAASVDYAQRRAAISSSVKSLTQRVGIETFSEFVWLRKSQFVARLTVDGWAPDAAAAKWDSMSRDPGVEKMQLPGEELRLAVQENPRTRVYRGRDLSVTVSGATPIDSTSAADEALAGMASVGTGVGSLTSPLMGSFGAVCRPGAAAASGQVLPMVEMAAPPTEMVLPASTFAGPVPAVSDDPRCLKRSVSEAADEVGGLRKRVKSAALGGVTGQLLQYRRDGLADGKALVERYGNKANNMAKRAEQAYQKIKVEMPDDEVSLVKKYNEAVAQARAVLQSVKEWTLTDAPDRLRLMGTLSDDLKSLSDLLAVAIERCQEKHSEARKEVAKKNAAAAKIRGRATMLYKSCPDNLIRYLYDQGALVPAASASAEDAVPDHESAYGLKSTFKCQSAENDHFDTKSPVLFSLKADGSASGHPPCGLIGAIGESVFVAAAQGCRKVAAATGTCSCKRLEPQGHPQDTIERLEWVPEQWTSTNRTPENLRGMGSPSCVSMLCGSCFSGDDGWPMVGVGQFLCMGQGQATVCLWPADTILQRGASLAKQWQFLYRDMHAKQFAEWADASMLFGRVHAGEVLWIPYGWYGAVVGRVSEKDVCSFLVQPVVTAAMTKDCSVWPAVSNFLESRLQEKLASNNALYTTWAGTAVKWLRTTADQHANPVGGDSSPDGGSLPAIQDVQPPPKVAAAATDGAAEQVVESQEQK